MPAQVEAGPRLTILSASLEPDVVGGLGVLASSGLEIHEVDVRIVDESRIVVVVEKISGMDVAAGGPLLVARAPRPALAGSASSGSNGSRGMDATEQAEHMSPVTGPIEIVMSAEPVTAPEAGALMMSVPPSRREPSPRRGPPMRSPSCSNRWPSPPSSPRCIPSRPRAGDEAPPRTPRRPAAPSLPSRPCPNRMRGLPTPLTVPSTTPW